MNTITFHLLYKLVLKHKSKLIKANLIALLATMISIPIPLLIPLLIDEVVFKDVGGLTHTINLLFGDFVPLGYIFVTLAITIVLRFGFFLSSVAAHFAFTEIAQDITLVLRKKLLLHLKRVAMHEYETLGSGAVASKLVTDMQTLEGFIGSALARSIVSILTLIGVATVLLLIEWRLGLLILVLHPAVVIITQLISRRVSVFKKEENKAISKFQNALIETLDLIGQIRASSKENEFIEKNIQDARELRDETARFGKKSFAAERFSFTLFLSVFEVFRALGIVLVLSSDLSLGLMFALFGYLWFMMTPVQDLLSLQFAYSNAKAALERLNKLFELEQEPLCHNNKNPFKGKNASIKVEKLNFSYSSGLPILKDINMHIKAGQKVALIGPSGSGKTTLAKVLSGFYPPKEGKLIYNDVPLNEIGLQTLRSNLFVVLQQPVLFNDTLRFNLSMGNDFSEEAILNALEIAQLSKFITEIPDGLDTLVGKGGVRLSGGQKQRLSIARMILSNPSFVIFDESTSALDVHTESDLFEALREFLEERTIITIAHRLSTVQNSDYIYVMEDGEIVEEGRPSELMDKEGHYKLFVKAQH
ncbi:ABC transporter ATP-binding protein [Sulfurimonas sp. MAG313]|nr:ABC transporter ATP-binding protein [Sulfurimonas sp. MAG313]MDF1880381.1 ABC transporter ATP-binding protein [Sulfurimonas sp. MAG313]